MEDSVDAYRRYCWTVQSVSDLKLAPFHLLASEGQVHIQKDHVWHMETLAKPCRADGGVLLVAPYPYKVVDVTDPASMEFGIQWWEELTERSGEGIVVKPLEFVAKGLKGLVEPGVKYRGPRVSAYHLRSGIHATWEHLERLRSRCLSAKRSLALHEFALGIEGLERFVRKEPLRRVHEWVFGVMALESEPVDPRL